jgi:hypothetical protein
MPDRFLKLKVGVPFSTVPSFKEVGLKSPFAEFAMPLAAFRDGYYRPSGTAVIIAPHLAITAKHVVEDFWKNYESSALTPDSHGSFSMVAVQMLESGQAGQLWTVIKVFCSRFTDVAFLQLMPLSVLPAEYRWRGPRINVLPPRVGSCITAFGYHSSKIDVKVDADKTGIKWFDSPTASGGEVMEIHEKKRDNAMLPFPCFRTNARFDHGMSGGPIFNEDGELCGLICSGFPFEEEHVSYGASLWPAMATGLDLPYEGFPSGAKYPFIELARRDIIAVHGWERITIVNNSRVSFRCP